MAASDEKRDVLLHYDEEAGELVFYTVPVSKTNAIRADEFGGVRPSIEAMKRLTPSEALIRVGGTALSLLDLSSKKKIGIAGEVSLPPLDNDEA